jgi:hypothetical protein
MWLDCTCSLSLLLQLRYWAAMLEVSMLTGFCVLKGQGSAHSVAATGARLPA